VGRAGSARRSPGRSRVSGVHVAAGYSWNRGATNDLASKITAEGCSVSMHQGNVGKSEDCQRVVSEVLEAKGRVDHLVNNADSAVDKTMRKMTVEDWHAVLRINLSGVFYMTKIVLDHVIGNGVRADRQHQLGGRPDGQPQAAGPHLSGRSRGSITGR
jgi:NAD(P)-dependent dehydrogenase (short-subunit alcohol dehydrogenase family)